MVLNLFRRKRQMTHEQIIRFVMTKSGLTQKELANYLEVNESSVHRWLIGARGISPKYWKPLIQLTSSLKAEDFLEEQNNGD